LTEWTNRAPNSRTKCSVAAVWSSESLGTKST